MSTSSRLVVAVALLVTLAACAGARAPAHAASTSSTMAPSHSPTNGARPATRAAATRRPCGWEKSATYQHVIWIWMENRSYSQVLGKGGASHLAAYAKKCGTATNYRAITHPSLPNYIAATSGSTHGISNDCDPSGCPVSGPSLYGELNGAGGWAGYAESMAHACDQASYSRYAARHNPAVYYTALRTSCRHHDLAMGRTHGRFAQRLQKGRLPAFTFVTPNLCDDGHDCTTSTADRWLGGWLKRITHSPQYRAGRTVLFVTWDEGETSSNQVATVVVAPTVHPGTRSGRHFTHYSLLRTTEQLLHVPLLGAARTAGSMRAAFHL